MKYVQCELKKGNRKQTAWIPARFAKLGTYLKLKDNDGWCVVLVGTELDETLVLDKERDYTRQRKASDL